MTGESANMNPPVVVSRILHRQHLNSKKNTTLLAIAKPTMVVSNSAFAAFFAVMDSTIFSREA